MVPPRAWDGVRFKCCASSCPGLPYRASERRHPCGGPGALLNFGYEDDDRYNLTDKAWAAFAAIEGER